MEIKGYSFTVAPGSPDVNNQRLLNLQEGKGIPTIKHFLIPQNTAFDLIFVTLKNVSTSVNYLVNVPLSSLRQQYFIPLNLPMGEYQISFRSLNLVNMNVDFSGVVDFK